MSNKDKDRILRRIKKCLALSESDNENEAASALRQARALMEKHGIELEEARQQDFDVLDKSKGKYGRGNLTQPELMLYGMVCEFFGCTMYSSANWPVIVGTAPAPEIAEYAAGTLLRQLRQNRKDALTRLEEGVGQTLRGGNRRDFNQTYGITWVCAVSKKIKSFAQSVTDEVKAQHEIAVRKHWDMDGEIKTRETRMPRRQSAVSQYAQMQGALDGKRAQLNHGVGEGPGQMRIEEEVSDAI